MSLNKAQINRRLEQAKDMARALERVPCQFFACPGPNVIPRFQETCVVCWELHRAYRLYPELREKVQK